jgi:hypothetical protein
MKFRKKPVVIEAIELTGEHGNVRQVLEFMGQSVQLPCRLADDRFEDYCSMVRTEGLKIKTLEGIMTASLGDYIIQGVQGEFYPCKPAIFEATYERVEE